MNLVTPPTPPKKEVYHSPLIRALFVAGLTLLLLIPLLFVKDLSGDRKYYANQAIADISKLWGKEQTLIGPMIYLPYTEGDTKEAYWILPNELSVSGQGNLSTRRKGIYQTPVYTADLQIEGSWSLDLLPQKKNITYHWDEAKVVTSISDMIGLKEHIKIRIAECSYTLSPDLSFKNKQGEPLESIYYEDSYEEQVYPFLTASLDGEPKSLSFSMPISVSGSSTLSILPIGSATEIRLTANWPSPSFTGNFLPETYTVSDKGFEALWRIVEYNRGYSSLLAEDNFDKVAHGENVSIKFLHEADQYTQTDRSIKYGILIIALTFVAIFFIDLIIRRKGLSRINPYHYLLVGLALALFYTLLLSFCEIIGFAWAYLIASLMIVSMISLYIWAIVRTKSYAWLIAGTTAFLYGYVYCLLQMASYALFAGSIGLFVILAAIMYISAKTIK